MKLRRLPLLLVLAAAPVLAQPIPRGFYAWWDSPVARDVHLSQDQLEKVHQIVREFRPRLIDSRGAVQKAELDVEDAFNEETVDSKHAADAIEKLVRARADLGRTLAQLSLRLRTTLTAEQWRELLKRRPIRDSMRGGQRGDDGRGPRRTGPAPTPDPVPPPAR